MSKLGIGYLKESQKQVRCKLCVITLLI